VEGDKADYERFRSDIDQIATTLTARTPFPELLVMARGAVRAMEDYNRRTGKHVHQQKEELQKMLSMLTKTVITIGSSSDASVGKLQDIEKSIERARMLEDIHALKHRLGECLDVVREETLRQKVDSQRTVESLQQQLECSEDRMRTSAAAPDIDKATGLPGKAEAEKAIQSALDAPNGKFLAIAVISRVQAVNARFGYAVGDKVLAACAEHFRNSLSASDQLYRWHGPALIAVFTRAERIDQVRAEIRRFADSKLEKIVDIGNRSIVIPISANWSVLPIAPTMEALLKKVEAFTAAQVPRDYV